MGKISRAAAVIIAVVALLSGCNAVEDDAVEPVIAKIPVEDVIPGAKPPDVPDVKPPGSDPILLPSPPPQPGSVKFAEANLPALKAAHTDKMQDLQLACETYKLQGFVTASDKERWVEAELKVPSAQAAEVAETAEQIRGFLGKPTFKDGLIVTAKSICQGHEVAEQFGGE